MKIIRFFSTVSILVLCLTTSGYQVQAQQPGSGSTSAANPSDSAWSIDLSTLLAQAAKIKRRGVSLMPELGNVNTSAPAFSITPMTSGNLPVTGSGTLGRLTKWTGFTSSNAAIGDSSIYEDKFGKVGIGTDSPTAKLTVAGTVEATGGFKFADGTVQTTSAAGALFTVAHDATLTGDGTVTAPLSVAITPDQPFQIQTPFTIEAGLDSKAASFTVPNNKRLVVEFGSGAGGVAPGQKMLAVQINTSINGTQANHYLVPVALGSGGGSDLFAVSQVLKIHASPGTTVTITVVRNATTGGAVFNLALSGHLVDAP